MQYSDRVAVKSWIVPTVSAHPRLIRFLGSSRVVHDSPLLTVLNGSEFHPVQRRPEVLALAELIRSSNYGSMLEIGTSTSGTSLLISRALRAPAHLTTVDVQARYDPTRLRKAIPREIDEQLLIADSHDHRTVDLVRGGREQRFDVVFIDGDHSYEGVRLDTERFAPLARPGGIVVFHDIQDARPSEQHSRDGVYVGGVPTWWRQIVDTSEDHFMEFVSDSHQSGFGIGVIRLPDTEAAVEALIARWSAHKKLD